MNTPNAPWLKFYGDIPKTLEYPQISMYEAVVNAGKTHSQVNAYEFQGKGTTYAKFIEKIDRTAKAYKALGIKEGETVTICMPNAPQGVDSFYALNRIGAVPAMIHPLSAAGEITFYLKDTDSKAILVLDMFYEKVEQAVKDLGRPVKIIVARIQDELKFPLNILYPLTLKKKPPELPDSENVIRWNDFIAAGKNETLPETFPSADKTAAILFSGGTTGTSKGILLSNLNMNALGMEVAAAAGFTMEGLRMLSVMPLFHGFGLGVCVHSMLSQGGRCILIPRFTAKSYAKQIVKYKCNFIAGVPTLYEALLRLPSMDNADLSSLKGVFSGGDSLSIELKKKFDKFLYDHKAVIQVREGYGTTECVTASCLTPTHMAKEGSIGLPFPDTYIKIVEPDTDREVPYGQEGEILLAGPTVMKEYMNNPEETAQTLRTHADGLTWVYTGDLGVMDEQGFIYFRGRAKRMIISSGYNVYPGQIENILDAHEYVQMSCVIGVPDPYKMQKVKAFVKLAQGVPATEETKQVLMAYCRKNVAKYAMPYDIECKEDMPKTLVGKVADRQLEEEELSKLKAQEEK